MLPPDAQSIWLPGTTDYGKHNVDISRLVASNHKEQFGPSRTGHRTKQPNSCAAKCKLSSSACTCAFSAHEITACCAQHPSSGTPCFSMSLRMLAATKVTDFSHPALVVPTDCRHRFHCHSQSMSQESHASFSAPQHTEAFMMGPGLVVGAMKDCTRKPLSFECQPCLCQPNQTWPQQQAAVLLLMRRPCIKEQLSDRCAQGYRPPMVWPHQ